MMENKYVYWNRDKYDYREVPEEWLDKLEGYFGDIDSHLDDNDELIIYKLIPFKTIKKEVTYKTKENE